MISSMFILAVAIPRTAKSCLLQTKWIEFYMDLHIYFIFRGNSVLGNLIKFIFNIYTLSYMLCAMETWRILSNLHEFAALNSISAISADVKVTDSLPSYYITVAFVGVSVGTWTEAGIVVIGFKAGNSYTYHVNI